MTVGSQDTPADAPWPWLSTFGSGMASPSDVGQLRVDRAHRVYLVGDQLGGTRGERAGGHLEDLFRGVRGVEPALAVQVARIQEPGEDVDAGLAGEPVG